MTEHRLRSTRIALGVDSNLTGLIGVIAGVVDVLLIHIEVDIIPTYNDRDQVRLIVPGSDDWRCATGQRRVVGLITVGSNFFEEV